MPYIVYKSLVVLMLPFAVLRLFWRSLKEPAYRQFIPERFGFRLRSHASDVWVHAVSAGESIAVAPMIERLLTSGQRIVVSTTTPSGRAQLQQQFGERVDICFAPFDAEFAVRRFLRHKQPKLVLLVETEIWPVWIRRCRVEQIPVALVNGRLSAKSFNGYKKLGRLMAQALSSLSQVLVQSESHAERFVALGAHSDRVHVLGSIKMDQALPADFKEQVNRIEQRAMGRRLWLAASTHPGEDLPMLKIYQKLREQQTNLRLVMAPRHVHRSGEIKLASEGLGFKTCRISTTTEWSDYDVLVVDVMGQLTAWYGASEVAFVGGSLVPHGGHNFMEAAIAGCAVVTGPHLFNFESLADHFQQAEALCRGSSEQEVADQVFALLNQEDTRLRQVNKADRLVQASRGAIDRSLHQLSPWLPQGGVQ